MRPRSKSDIHLHFHLPNCASWSWKDYHRLPSSSRKHLSPETHPNNHRPSNYFNHTHPTMDRPHSHKRTADESSTPFATTPTPPHTTTSSEPPLILRRHQHRRSNIATSTWGVDTAPAPHPPFPPQPSLRPPSGTTPRPSTSAPPPHRPFNIYKSLLRHPHLFFTLCIRLPYPTLLALYAIDKEFHYRLNKYSVGLIHEYTLYWAPRAAPIFTWTLFPHLCISDPMLRPMDGRAWLARDVPGFRWVGMVLGRQRVVREVLSLLGREGVRVPRGAFEVLCKLWCLMECKTQAVREAVVRDRRVWGDEEVLVLQLVFIKLDMHFSDPVLGNGTGGLAGLLLAQKGLGLLADVLSGRVRLGYDEVTDLVLRTYLGEDLDTDMHPWLLDEIDNGVPEEEWGVLSREGWDVDGKRMDSAVDVVVMEGIRRGLDVQRHYLDFVLYGFVDEDGENVAVPLERERNGGTDVVEVGWPREHVREEALRYLEEATRP